MDQSPTVTVFEAINRPRKEVFIGATALTMAELMFAFRRAPPSAARHWTRDDAVEFRSLEFGMDPRDAEAFIREYSATMARGGWLVSGRP
jgi:hypothetical protein